MSESRTVQLGDQTYTIQRFTAFKALYAGELVTSIMEKMPDLSEQIAEVQRKYRDENSLRLTRAAAEMRFDAGDLADISEEAWKANNHMLEIPASPSGQEIALRIFPQAWTIAREPVLELFSLLVIPNSELREADEADDVKGALERYQKRLMHEDMGELVDLIAIGTEVLREQFEGKAEKLTGVLGMFGLQRDSIATPETTSKQDSFTDSEKPTAGPESTSSTESDTPISAASGGS